MAAYIHPKKILTSYAGTTLPHVRSGTPNADSAIAIHGRRALVTISWSARQVWYDLLPWITRAPLGPAAGSRLCDRSARRLGHGRRWLRRRRGDDEQGQRSCGDRRLPAHGAEQHAGTGSVGGRDRALQRGEESNVVWSPLRACARTAYYRKSCSHPPTGRVAVVLWL
jgi:hypothetical protein